MVNVEVGADSPPGDDRRGQMLAAAAELIAERGFAQTRIADVAQRVGASPGLVVYYFETKDKLLTEALRYSESSFYVAAEALLHSKATLAQRLESLVELTFESKSKSDFAGSWGLWFDLWTQAFRHPQVALDRRELDDQWRSLIERVVRSGVADGEIAEVDAEEFAVSWAAYLDGLAVQVALDDPHVDIQRATRLALRFAARELALADPADAN